MDYFTYHQREVLHPFSVPAIHPDFPPVVSSLSLLVKQPDFPPAENRIVHSVLEKYPNFPLVVSKIVHFLWKLV
jgi:hypothetical protein